MEFPRQPEKKTIDYSLQIDIKAPVLKTTPTQLIENEDVYPVPIKSLYSSFLVSLVLYIQQQVSSKPFCLQSPLDKLDKLEQWCQTGADAGIHNQICRE